MNTQSFENFLDAFTGLRNDGKPFVVVTLVQAIGSTPQDLGARAIVGQDGLVFGTVGGGRVEHRAIELARELITSGKKDPQFVQWNLQKDIGMSCGGVAGLFFEPHLPALAWKVAVFGAGHVAQELVRYLLRLECQVYCIDSRPEWLAKLPEDPKLRKICAAEMADALEQIPQETFIACMTMGHRTDVPILTRLLCERRPPYVGVIGSEVKGIALRKDLREAGIAEERVHEIRCPMGEDFGTNSPAEIALSVAAQLLRVRDQGKEKL